MLSPVQYRITIAVAGFSEAELQLSAKDDELVVTGRKETSNDNGTYLHRGIAARQFERHFRLASYMVVKGAELKDGLLRIDLARELPETLKPRRIEIRSGENGLAALDLMDKHLAERKWFVADQFSLADICLFAYTHVADEADFDLEAYPEIVRWMERIMTMDGHVGLED